MVKVAHAEVVVEYGVAASAQDVLIDPSGVTTFALGSVDLAVDANLESGTLHFLVEGSSSAVGSASDVVNGVNAGAGTVANVNANVNTTGGLQLSEISYAMNFGAYVVSVGVQNLFSFMDMNSTSNAQAEQFMASSLVNNPTIAAPDYTVSTVVNYGYEDKSNMVFMIANAYGLADNDTADYADLIDFGQTPAGLDKGLFGLAELRMEDQGVWLTLGTWVNTQEENPLKGSYINLDSAEDENFAWSFRYGQSDDAVGVKTFGSFSTSTAYGDGTLGVAVGVQKLAAVGANIGDMTMLETYYRWQLSDSFSLTPDIQYWRNANGFLANDTATGVVGGNVAVYGLRLQYAGATTF